VPTAQLDAVLAAGYGIFSGSDVEWAKLRFSPQRARWVAAEQWHPQQRTRWEDDGAYVLELPYSDSRELIMDILKHGADVEVLAPETLRRQVSEALGAALQRYSR
jgi:predicted DNA-binding transcriptional regulator YafY